MKDYYFASRLRDTAELTGLPLRPLLIEAADELDRLGAWRPTATMPRDGRSVLIWISAEQSAYEASRVGNLIYAFKLNRDVDVEHVGGWLPFPDPLRPATTERLQAQDGGATAGCSTKADKETDQSPAAAAPLGDARKWFDAGWKAAKLDELAADDEDVADAPDVAFADYQREAALGGVPLLERTQQEEQKER